MGILNVTKHFFFERGRELTALLCAVVAMGGIIPSTGGTTYYSGKGASNGTVLSTIVNWYTDESRTTLADPQPTPTENDDNTYVFLESGCGKIEKSFQPNKRTGQ